MKKEPKSFDDLTDEEYDRLILRISCDDCGHYYEVNPVCLSGVRNGRLWAAYTSAKDFCEKCGSFKVEHENDEDDDVVDLYGKSPEETAALRGDDT